MIKECFNLIGQDDISVNTRKFWKKKTLLFSKKLIDLSFWTILNLDMPPNLTKGAQSKFKQV